MSPRKYDIGKRAAAAGATRRRIVEATMSLHDQQGVAATSWDQIAERAGVGVGTVYRHFPSLDELLPACGARAMPLLAAPPPSEAKRIFAGLDGRPRISRLVDEIYGIYERGAVIVEALEREHDVHPVLEEAHGYSQSSIDALTRESLRPLRLSADQRKTVRALLDVRTWRAFDRSGLSHAKARAAATQLAEAAAAG